MVWTAAWCEPFEEMNPSNAALKESTVINEGSYKAVLGKESGENFISSPDFGGYLSSSHAFYKEDDTLYLKEFSGYSFAVAKTVNFPILFGDRYFSVDYGSSFIEEYDESGSILWFWRGLAPLTALAWNNDFTVIGSLDGNVSLIDKSGEVTGFPVYPADGDNVVYGVAVSGDSKRVAIISGLRNQYLRTYALGDSPQLLSQLQLKSRYRRPVKMYYSDDAAYLWVEQEEGLLQYSDESPALLIPVDDSFLTMRHDKEGNLIYILSRTGDDSSHYSLKSYSPDGKLLFQNKFEYFPDSFQLNSSDVLFSINNNLMILNREEM